MNENLLKFQPFSTVQSISFWQKLSDLKLNLYQLNDSTRLIYGHYSTSAKPKIPARLFFDEESFETNKPPKFEHVRIKVPATLKLFNTASGFKNCKSNELLRKSAEQIFSGIFDGSVLLDPSVLNSVLFLAFADLKLNRFSYLVGIPAIISPRPFERVGKTVSFEECFGSDGREIFGQFFSDNAVPPFFAALRTETKLEIENLRRFDEIFFAGEKFSEVFFAFLDPSSLDDHPGWPLRNFLILISSRWHFERVKILCFRPVRKYSGISFEKSFVLEVILKGSVQMDLREKSAPKIPSITGWEVNEKGKHGPKTIDLSNHLSPLKLAEQSVDLNIRLMRWRLLPELNVEALSSLKCLVFNCGGVGCNVVRGLLGWGVKNFTLVDSSSVSKENLFEETLFDFSHAGKNKAFCASDSVLKIFPCVKSEGVDFEVPKSADLCEKSKVQVLESLIERNDVIFLLFDQKDEFQVPTIVSTLYDKITISVFLDKSSFKIVRHGGFEGQKGEPNRLGCFFCCFGSDFSTEDECSERINGKRNRLGISMVASSLAVELLIGLVHDPKGHRAKADSNSEEDFDMSSKFGLLPHQIIGRNLMESLELRTTFAGENCNYCTSKATAEFKSTFKS